MMPILLLGIEIGEQAFWAKVESIREQMKTEGLKSTRHLTLNIENHAGD